MIRKLFRRALANLTLGWYSPLGQRIVIIGVALIVAYLSSPTSAFAQSPGGDIKSGLVNMVKGLIDLMILVGSLILAVGMAGNWISGQIAVSVGSPGGLSHMWIRLAGVIIAFIGLVATIPVTNIIIDQVSKAIPDQSLKTAR